MKTFLLGALLLLASATTGAREAPLPGDSVYQLQAQLIDQDGRTQPWAALRGKPRLVAMFYTSCQYICPLIVESGKAIERQLTPAEQVLSHGLPVSNEELAPRVHQEVPVVRAGDGYGLLPKLRRLFGRSELERDELNILRGILSAVQNRRRRAGPAETPGADGNGR